MNRIHWKSTARHGEIQVKEFDLEQTADAWIVLDLQRAIQTGAATSRRPRSAIRAAAPIADKALIENRAVGMTVNARRPAYLPPDRGGRQHLKIMQLLAASSPMARRRSSRRSSRAWAAAARHDRGDHHGLGRSCLGPRARRRCAVAASPAVCRAA
jgi:uncharacterized protein (DUF58 family)